MVAGNHFVNAESGTGDGVLAQPNEIKSSGIRPQPTTHTEKNIGKMPNQNRNFLFPDLFKNLKIFAVASLS